MSVKQAKAQRRNSVKFLLRGYIASIEKNLSISETALSDTEDAKLRGVLRELREVEADWDYTSLKLGFIVRR